MHRLNLTIDEPLYEQARLHSFVSKKSISQMVREGLSLYLRKKTNDSVKAQLVLEAKDEEEILEILAEDNYITDGKFAKKFNL
ncbi:hypothetical protein SPONN_1317 [uncultured Candidatus Thioglobus sp.]|nr:hypothetical protein SPONN_1317 [uncultured Candidatus Thioglobus sp.]